MKIRKIIYAYQVEDKVAEKREDKNVRVNKTKPNDNGWVIKGTEKERIEINKINRIDIIGIEIVYLYSTTSE